MVTLRQFCALDSGLLLVRKADSYTCSMELEANLILDRPGFRFAAGKKGRFLEMEANLLQHPAVASGKYKLQDLSCQISPRLFVAYVVLMFGTLRSSF